MVLDYNGEGNAEDNSNRREKRQTRRLRSRRKNRIEAIKHLLINNGIIDKVIPLNNIYELKYKYKL